MLQIPQPTTQMPGGSTPQGQPPQGQPQAAPQGPAINLNDLISGATNYQQSMIDKANAMDIYKNNGIQFGVDPTTGAITKIQGQTPTQQKSADIGIQQQQLALSGPTISEFPSALQQAIQSGQYTATGEQGKTGREALISSLTSQFGKVMDPAEIAAQVYNSVKDTTGKTETAQTIQSKWDEQALMTKNAPTFNAALGAINKLKAAVDKVNYDGSKLSPGYVKKSAELKVAVAGGNNADIANLQASAATIIESLKALTNTGRITQQEMDSVGTISPFDTKTQALAKLNTYGDMLSTAMGKTGPSAPSVNSLVPGGTPSPAADPLGLYKVNITNQ